MSTLIRNGQALASDDYVLLADDAVLPSSGAVIVSLDRWRNEAPALRDSGLTVGIQLPNTVDVLALWPEISDRPLVALNFPGFGDGRAYSQARLLKSRLGYEGELRAIGAAVVADQATELLRCGFDSLALRADQNPEQVLRSVRLTQSEPYIAIGPRP